MTARGAAVRAGAAVRGAAVPAGVGAAVPAGAAVRAGAVRGTLAALAGCLVACSLPPIGWWPLGIAGTALLAGLLAGQRLRVRLLVGLLAGAAQMGIGCSWAAQFSRPGYAALIVVEALFVVAATGAVPPGAGRVAGFSGALVLAEAARESFPFGGLPLASAALGQASGPLSVLARLGGPLAVTAGVALAGAGLAELALALALPLRSRSVRHRLRQGTTGLCACGAVGAMLFAAMLAGDGGRPVRQLTVAVVQGGRLAPPGDVIPASEVLATQIEATRRLHRHVDLVLWPEDVVALDEPLAGSAVEQELAATARRLRTTLVAGVTEPAGPRSFRNEMVALAPSGRVVATVEKAHPVPFGEYVPDRALFSHFVNLSAVPANAIAGHNDGELAAQPGPFAVLVSFETFFSARGRSGVRAGGEALLVPTNTASYASSQVPGQELAASRLQAVAEGRDVLQAATTGYSALISPSGAVLASSSLDRPATLVLQLPLRRGATPYVRLGDGPLLGVAALALGAGWALMLASSTGASCAAGRPASTGAPPSNRDAGRSGAPCGPASAGAPEASPPTSARPSGRSTKRTRLKSRNLPTQMTA
jgi:apolipoprotein N-acyltransferase